MRASIPSVGGECRAPLHEKCPNHHGYKGYIGVIPMICGVVGERAQMIIVWVRALGVGNASHPHKHELRGHPQG